MQRGKYSYILIFFYLLICILGDSFIHLQVAGGIEREVTGQKGEIGHQLKDTNYGTQNYNPFFKKTLNTHSYGAKKQLVYSK